MTGSLSFGPQNVGTRAWAKRCVMSVLGEGGLTGPRASGVASVHATGVDVVLPAGSYATPLIVSAAGGAQLDPTRLVKTTAPIIVTAAGVDVPIVSMVGGLAMNLPIDTVLRWAPAIPGVETTSLITTAMTGGAEPTAPGTIKRVVTLDQLALGGAREANANAWRAKIGAFPAAVVALTGTTRGERIAKGTRLRMIKLRVFVLSGTNAGTEQRESDAEAACDRIEALIEDRKAVDGESFGNYGVEVVGSGVYAANDGADVYYVDLEVPALIERIELRTFTAWLETQAQVVTPTDDDHPDSEDALVVADVSVSMT